MLKRLMNYVRALISRKPIYKYIETEYAGLAAYDRGQHVGWILSSVNEWWSYEIVNYRFNPTNNDTSIKYGKCDTIEEAKEDFQRHYESLRYWQNVKSLAEVKAAAA